MVAMPYKARLKEGRKEGTEQAQETELPRDGLVRV